MSEKIYINGRFLTQTLTGVQRVAYEISSRLNAKIEDVEFLCPKSVFKFDVNGFKLIQFGWFKGQLWEQIDLPFFLFKKKYKLILNFCNSAPILASKKMIVIHDMAVKRGKDWYNWKFRLWYEIMFYFNISKQNLIITDSEFSKFEIEHFYKNTDIKVVYLGGFDTPVYNTEIEKYRFIAISSIEPRKDFKTIIEAFAKLESMEIQLEIIGGSSHVFKSLDFDFPSNVTFLGRLSDDDMKKKLASAYGFISSSLYEGFGLPVLEAQSFGVPTIISDIPVYKELFGESVIYFDVKNSSNLAKQIQSFILNGNREEWSTKSINNAQKYNWEKCTIKYSYEVNNYIKNKSK
jgi:glycosyltransferase involved in cell wall biosynthesis